ncbi:uncharacterized protein LOC102808356 [Saccoglossus kowalevskii]|uniref:Uncharacterized protein LOC102808356 n=1 Tax=Saccoglossus kowalevskii TaxID=10224 RepID=A0ABM0MNE2_SACKO|nr:PREDICTED: uncharacterized protein LOC102808356 [Saccoglossus kowalevskii]
MAKTRVKPIKPTMTLPGLEIMAATIATRLAKFALNALTKVNIVKCVLWSDSQIALYWIKSDKKLPVFVTNRAREIRDGPFNEIKYYPTADNPDDLLTRGITATGLSCSTLWWEGPNWLKRVNGHNVKTPY